MSNRSELYQHSDGSRFRGNSIAETFTTIHEKRIWQESPESTSSGTGSTLRQTAALRTALPRIFEKYEIRTMLDLPCGDHGWMKTVDMSKLTRYVGADIVESLILNNQAYSTDQKQFKVLDLTAGPVDCFDLVFVRDCFVHFSFEMFSRALRNIQRSSSRFLLTTTFTEETRNKDIDTGGWRPINLRLAPYNLPEPLETINEQCTEFGDTFKDKSMALWRIADIAR